VDVAPSDAGGFAVWDVVRVAFLYADAPTTRSRPALVIATPAVENDFAVLWVLMITSARRGLWPLDVMVSDLTAAGLSHPCVVRPGKIATLDARLASRIGQLAAADRPRVVEGVLDMLGDILAPSS
jgi:mRNA interferase MazF